MDKRCVVYPALKAAIGVEMMQVKYLDTLPRQMPDVSMMFACNDGSMDVGHIKPR